MNTLLKITVFIAIIVALAVMIPVWYIAGEFEKCQ